MHRRYFIRASAFTTALFLLQSKVKAGMALLDSMFRKNRPDDKGWPTEAQWMELSKAVSGHLYPLKDVAYNEAVFKNPYAIGDNPSLTQTRGWFKAWTSNPSAWVLEAHNAQEISEAIRFANQHRLRVVVKGGGHSYQGNSCSKDSLLIWTRKMNAIELQDDTVTIESGAVWMQAYDAVTTKGKRYVQGGGCATVGVAGLIQSGGFGSFSKQFGLAAAGLLEAEVVTADGKIKTVNEQNDPDLFWALKGGGGGNFAVVIKLKLRTHVLPEFFGAATGKISASSDEAYKHLISGLMSHYRDHLLKPNWGEQIRFRTNRRIDINMMFAGLTKEQANVDWQPFMDWVKEQQGIKWDTTLNVVALPAQHLWNGAFLKKYAPDAIKIDDRPGAPESNIYWAGDGEEAGQFLHAYHSAWIPEELLSDAKLERLAEAIFKAGSLWTVSLHFNKGLAGSSEAVRNEASHTAMNPLVSKSFALAIIAGGTTDKEPDMKKAMSARAAIDQSMNELTKVLPERGSYVSESSFFEAGWQHSFWGNNYEKLKAVKKKYDPTGLFFMHHGAGSENWSQDGFEKKI
ncbi:FAD-dependent oxidoreductase [Ferruginibacter sp.]